MAPEPDQHAVLARMGEQLIREGEDMIRVLLWVAKQAVKIERQQQALRGGWQNEDTPTMTAAEKLNPSQRPTRPPPAPLPLGVPGEGRRTPTIRTPVPPAWKKR